MSTPPGWPQQPHDPHPAGGQPPNFAPGQPGYSPPVSGHGTPGGSYGSAGAGYGATSGSDGSPGVPYGSPHTGGGYYSPPPGGYAGGYGAGSGLGNTPGGSGWPSFPPPKRNNTALIITVIAGIVVFALAALLITQILKKDSPPSPVIPSTDVVMPSPQPPTPQPPAPQPTAPEPPQPPSPSLEPGPTIETVDFYSLVAGDCLLKESILAPDADMFNIPIISCVEPHSAEIFAVLYLEEEEFPGSDAIKFQTVEMCEAEFLNYVGVKYQSSPYQLKVYHPTENSWPKDDRRVTCIAYQDELFTGQLPAGMR